LRVWSLQPGSFLSFLSAATISLAIYVALVLAGAEWKLAWTSSGYLVLFTFASALVILSSLFCDNGWFRHRLLRLRKPVYQWLMLFTLYLAVWPFLLFFFTKVDGFNGTGMWLWGVAICVPSLTAFAHWIWYVVLRVEQQKTLNVRLVVLGAVVLYAGLPFLLVDATANTLGLGMMRHVDLVLTTRGCDIVHAGWPERVCTPDHREGVEMGVLDDVEVLTRIGSQYYLAPPGGIEDAHLARITVPASEVLEW